MKNNRFFHTGLFVLSALMIAFAVILPQKAEGA
jgi:hypothetical protein